MARIFFTSDNFAGVDIQALYIRTTSSSNVERPAWFGTDRFSFSKDRSRPSEDVGISMHQSAKRGGRGCSLVSQSTVSW